jgi:hypothetical protein
MSLESKAKSYREIAEECFEPDDLVNDKLAFSLLSSTHEWVRFVDANYIIQKLKTELEFYKEANRELIDFKRKILTEVHTPLAKIAEARQIIEDYGCGECTPAILLRQVLSFNENQETKSQSSKTGVE